MDRQLKVPPVASASSQKRAEPGPTAPVEAVAMTVRAAILGVLIAVSGPSGGLSSSQMNIGMYSPAVCFVSRRF